MPVYMGALAQTGSSSYTVELVLPEAVTVWEGLVFGDAAAVGSFNAQAQVALAPSGGTQIVGYFTSISVEQPTGTTPCKVILYVECDIYGAMEFTAQVTLPANSDWCVSASRGVPIGGWAMTNGAPYGSFFMTQAVNLNP